MSVIQYFRIFQPCAAEKYSRTQTSQIILQSSLKQILMSSSFIQAVFHNWGHHTAYTSHLCFW